MRFSANLGFLWTELALPDAIRAAKTAGFDAVELHWPYDEDAAAVRAALDETGLPCLGLNTVRGDVEAGDFGLAAQPGRGPEARAAVDQALAYGQAIGAGAVHVMAGKSSGTAAHAAFCDILRYACAAAGQRMILIEPINAVDAPGYFLRDTAHATEIIEDLSLPNLKIMFDCYHVARSGGDVLAELVRFAGHIGHIQFAAVPDRGPPDHGEVDYAQVFAAVAAMGWESPLGAEYKPGGPTEATLGWMAQLR